MKGKKIETVEQVIELALLRKSVCGITGISRPAAVMQNMQALVLYNWIKNGLYEYIPKEKKPFHLSLKSCLNK